MLDVLLKESYRDVQWECGLNLTGSGQVTVTRCYEHGSETSGPKTVGNFLNTWAKSLSRRIFFSLRSSTYLITIHPLWIKLHVYVSFLLMKMETICLKKLALKIAKPRIHRDIAKMSSLLEFAGWFHSLKQ